MKKENIFSVSEVNRHLKNVIESNIPTLYVEGEIANYTHHNSGHIYFSLKDRQSSLRCVFFRSYNLHLNFQPKVGDKVICSGKLSIFERAGNYQLNVTKMLPAGMGELQIKFEELKEKLASEGLFDEQYKKPIPKFPEKIGVVTSATGAAIQDIQNVISRRFPCRIFLYPATVQGDKAAAEIIAGIKYFNTQKEVDVLIVGRGGGSQEDLFCFNDEALARVIFASQIPIISAVGHEIDFTISDFVADLRAPTPSAAAELAVPSQEEIVARLNFYSDRIENMTSQLLKTNKLVLGKLKSSIELYHPKFILQNLQQSLDRAKFKFNEQVRKSIELQKNRVQILKGQLRELSPQQALKRGYSIIRQEKKVINSIKLLHRDRPLEVLLSDGSCNCEIIEITENNQQIR